MDITVKNQNRYANRFINGETVNYSIAYAVSFFILIAVKQFLKTFIGLETSTSCMIAFIIAEAVLFLFERFFVFKSNITTSKITQGILFVLNTAMHFGIYKLAHVILCGSLNIYDFTVWLMVAVFIFIFNYPLARILIFGCMDKADNKNGGRVYRHLFRNRFIILSMLVSLVAMGFMFIVFKVFPFGDTTVLRMDLYHQYGPLFVELFDRLSDHETFLYSWTAGGGSSFLGNYFNYLSSPINILIFLFDREQMPYAISFLVAVKCMLTAGTFTLYIKKSQRHHSFISAAFGVMYAFSAYMLAYFWNIMWLDGMVMLPLIILGIENILNSGRCRLYILSLIYLMYSSYYMGYMVCIFSVIYFIAYYLLTVGNNKIDSNFISSKKFSLKALSNNKFINRGFRFAVSSLLAGAVCACVLIPVCFILSSCSATSDSFPDSAKSYFTVLDFIQSHFAGLETTIRSSGEDVLPNVYCGVLTLLLVPLFIVNKEIKLKEKIIYISLLLIMFVSFNTNYVNFIWHAFHFPNDLPYRFSYIYSFILLVISFKAIAHIKAVGIKEIGFTAMFWLAFAAISQELPTNKISDFSIYVTIAFIIIWTAFFFAVKKRRLTKIVIGTLIISVTFCEVIISDTNAFSFNQDLTNYNENYDTYVESVNYLEENDTSFYRTELCSLNTRMDPCLYGYRGISTFSSMAYEQYSRLQYSLGMYGNRINSHTYNTQTPVYNLMYAIKYLIHNNENVKPSTALYTRCYEAADDKSVIYSNDYTLPIAYCVNSAVDLWSTAEGNPFQIQSDFFTLATGFSDVFTEAEYISCNYDGMTGDNVAENGSYWFNKNNADYGSIDITLKSTRDGNFYLYLTSPDIRNISCMQNNVSITTQEIETPYILDLGYFNEGDEITVSIDGNSVKDDTGYFEIYAYSLNQNVLNEGYERLLENVMDITDYSGTKIKGSVIADDSCILYSSIPYDKGWSVYIDGEKAETFEIGGCQLGVMIKAGKHTVEYVYRPQGMYLGAAVSIAAILALSGYEILKRKINFIKVIK